MKFLGVMPGLVLALTSCAPGVTHEEGVARSVPPAYDPFSSDGRIDGGIDGGMVIRGAAVEVSGECGRLELRRVSEGAPLMFDEPGLAHRARVESYDRKLADERCQIQIGDDVALVASHMTLDAEFGTPPGIIVSVRPLMENHVAPWWLVALPLRTAQP